MKTFNREYLPVWIGPKTNSEMSLTVNACPFPYCGCPLVFQKPALAVLDTKDRQALTSCSMAQAPFLQLGKCSHLMDHRANGPMPQTREHGACSTTQ